MSNEIIVPEIVPTMPLNQPISPVLSTPLVKANEDKVEVRAVQAKEDIPEAKPWYIWKGRSTYYPSKVEMSVVEEFIKSKSYSKCVKAVKERCNKQVSVDMVKRCLERDHVKEFLVQKLDEEGVKSGMTEGWWLKKMADHLDGTERLRNGDLFAMGLIAKHRGWGVAGGTAVVTTINFTERQ